MGKIVIANIIVFVIVYGICTIIGLDLKKWYSWLAGLYGFFSGCLAGFIREDDSPSLQLGLLFAIVIMSSGAMTCRNRRRYSREAAEEWSARYGQEKHYSLLARIIEKLLGKR
jgi:hydrogenase/urease accessory protein HupE